MSGELRIPSLAKKMQRYHDPAHGIFHVHYANPQLAHFGLSWLEDISEKRTVRSFRKRKIGRKVVLDRQDYIPLNHIRWFLSYLRQREPSKPIDYGEGAVIGLMAQSLAESGADVVIVGEGDPEYDYLIRWRDELCAFLSKAIALCEPIEALL
jgi:hypothetical protein